jgi:hypothetical protein
MFLHTSCIATLDGNIDVLRQELRRLSFFCHSSNTTANLMREICCVLVKFAGSSDSSVQVAWSMVPTYGHVTSHTKLRPCFHMAPSSFHPDFCKQIWTAMTAQVVTVYLLHQAMFYKVVESAVFHMTSSWLTATQSTSTWRIDDSTTYAGVLCTDWRTWSYGNRHP